MSGFAELLRAVAAIMWPSLLAGVIYFYREEIRAVLKRVSHFRKGKIFGQEFELTEELDRLQRSVIETTAEIVTAPSLLSPPQASPAVEDDLEQRLLQNTDRSPKIALMQLGFRLEHRLKLLGATTGWTIGAQGLSQSVEVLHRQGTLPSHTIDTVKLFSSVRSKLIHEGNATDDEILRAIDSGISLLRAIDSIPVASHTVVQTEIPIYSDEAGLQPLPGVFAVMLEEASPLMPNKIVQIFPTTKSHFRVGQQVAWEWNMSNIWGTCWYRDAENRELKQAWVSSAEFVGRPWKLCRLSLDRSTNWLRTTDIQ